MQTIYPAEQKTVAINVSQSIFNGFKDYSQYKIQSSTKTAQEYNAQNEIETTQEQIDINRHILNTLTDLDKNTPLSDSLFDENIHEPLEFYLATIKKRPEILAAEKQIEIASTTINQTRGNYLPSLSLQP